MKKLSINLFLIKFILKFSFWKNNNNEENRNYGFIYWNSVSSDLRLAECSPYGCRRSKSVHKIANNTFCTISVSNIQVLTVFPGL